jgi:hypothetical protein
MVLTSIGFRAIRGMKPISADSDGQIQTHQLGRFSYEISLNRAGLEPCDPLVIRKAGEKPTSPNLK